MAEGHISLPKPFASSDVKEWLQRFEICSRANGWDATKWAKKLPTLLEGEALAVWIELTTEQQDDYDQVKTTLEKAMMPMNFMSLDNFHRRRLRPGEAITLYAHDLRKLLTHAIPGVAQASREPLLLRQFLAGIPEPILRQLRASGEVTTLDKAIERARLLMTINPEPVATLQEKPDVHKPDDMQILREQMAALTEQVAALTTKQSRVRQPTRRLLPRCFNCNQVGHLQRDCCNQRCFFCGKLGHLSKDCWHQGNANGVPAQGNWRPNQ